MSQMQPGRTASQATGPIAAGGAPAPGAAGTIVLPRPNQAPVAQQPGAPVPAEQPAAVSTAKTGTPGRLRLMTVAVVLAGVLFALGGAVTFGYLAYSLNRAEADSTQLVRVQNIETNLLVADATATNAFLVGGLEPPEQRATYDEALKTTSLLIADAAQAQPADSAALAALNELVVGYAADVEQARANNRQGFPVGSQYLRNASDELRTKALPLLDNLTVSNTERAGANMGFGAEYLFEIVGLLCLAVTVLVAVWLARRFRRWINVGVVAASVVLLVGLVGGFIGLTNASSEVDQIRRGSFSDLQSTATMRVDANIAKSDESLTLIARGSGAAFEDDWQARSKNITATADGNLAALWKKYVGVHGEIRTIDNGGNWDKAVGLATGRQQGSSNASFTAFDQAAREQLTGLSSTTAAGLSAPQNALTVGAILVFLAGIGAALLGRWGVAARLKEYR